MLAEFQLPIETRPLAERNAKFTGLGKKKSVMLHEPVRYSHLHQNIDNDY